MPKSDIQTDKILGFYNPNVHTNIPNYEKVVQKDRVLQFIASIPWMYSMHTHMEAQSVSLFVKVVIKRSVVSHNL